MQMFFQFLFFISALQMCSTISWAAIPRDTLQVNFVRKKIVIAVIDTGLDLSHAAVRKNIWLNPGESGFDAQGNDKRTNEIDDDKNGFVDDVSGWNFVGQNHDLEDHHGHGTHISGIINQFGTLLPELQLMTLKYCDPMHTKVNTVQTSVEAIRYAVRMNVDIINYSGGGTIRSLAEELALKDAERKGILVIAAAGNESRNTDLHGFFPASYPMPHILSVAAVDQNNQLLPTSNFGLKTTDLAAPGKSIVSALPGGTFGPMTGTSQATAQVTAIAALTLSYQQKLFKQPLELIQVLKSQTLTLKNQLKVLTDQKSKLN